MGLGDLAGYPGVGLADFDKRPAAGQQVQRPVDEVSGEAVEHHVHALVVGRSGECFDEIERPR
uniref:Uncharacterized protein n=1 Tax=Mycobacterium riyadhense TaxID=486698 RepID=A0A653EV94_9MYCO|nr:hypothetical protein BIN_B_03952 [Mycobacterium riyadhense]